MKPLLIALLFLAACGPSMTVMHNPDTGQTVQCQAFLNQYGSAMDQRQRKDCVRQYQLLGFQAVDPRHGVKVKP
jgi:hypothetical protein